jgi:hypothetical protein
VECPQSSTTMVRGVNNLGEAVGVCYTDNGYSSFVRKRNGTFVWVDYPGALYTEAYAINDYGHVVGFYSNEAEQDQPNELGFYGFLYRHGQFQRLYGPSPNDIIFPTGINLLGDIVGGAYANFDHWSYTPRGFLLKDGQFTFLDVNPLGAPGVHNTWARAINNVGQILLTEFGDAYLWKNGAILQLPPVEGFTYTDLYANGLNDFGEIVGWYVGNMLVDGHWQQHSHGFLATPVWHTAPPNGQASLR